MISKGIYQLSSSKEVFEAEALVYNTALKNSGYSEGLQYNDIRAQHTRRARKRKITWFNFPWNDEVATILTSSLVYKCLVSTEKEQKEYIRPTANRQ